MKTPLVLLPGLSCDAAVWQPQIGALGDVARTWVADLTRDDTVAAMADRVLAEVPFPRFSLAGFSMGGYVSLALWRRAPERIARLALVGTSARPDSPQRREERTEFVGLARHAKRFSAITRTTLPFLVHPSRLQDAALVSAVREMGERVGAEAFVAQQLAILGRDDSRAALPAIRCPVLVLCGDADQRTPVDLHEEMAAAIPGAELVIVERSGHMVTLECPDAVSAALRHWLLRPEGRPSLPEPG